MHRTVRIVALTLLAAITKPAAADPTSSSLPSGAPTPIPLAKASLAAQSTTVSLDQIDADDSRDRSNVDGIARTVAELTGEIDPRLAEDTRLLSSNSSLELLYRLKQTWQSFADSAATAARQLTQYATGLEDRLARLNSLESIWQATAASARETNNSGAVQERLHNLIATIAQARETAKSRQTQVLTLLSEASEAQSRIQTVLSEIAAAEQRTLSRLFVKDSPTIWGLVTGLNSELKQRSDASLSAQLRSSNAFTRRLPLTMLLHLFWVLLLAGVFYWFRRKLWLVVKANPEFQRALPILELPVSAAFAFSILLVPPIYTQAPRLIQSLVGIILLFPITLFLRRLLLRSSYPIINGSLVLFFLGQIRLLTASLPMLSRLIFLIQMLAGIVFLAWVVFRWRMTDLEVETHRGVQRTVLLVARVGLLALPTAFVASALGYTNLGYVLGLLYLRSLFTAGLLYAVFRILEGLIAMALRLRPLGSLRVVKIHREMLQKRINGVAAFLALLVWLNLVLNFIGLRDPLLRAIKSALEIQLMLGAIDVTPGQILAFLLTVWSSFLISKFLRFILEEDLYERVHLAHGIPYAISTMSHYTILLLGFLIGLGAMGIDLTKVTILAGAFSVGIGFGLQNVINNFVSGLILLFERPIKVGDVIEVGGNVGEVGRIGIRASVIRTAEGSEVIVPNGSLISNQVTNWTLSDRKRSVEVTVNVAASADPGKVVYLLKSTATAHAGVANDPGPDVYVVSLSPNAVTFQLRVWTDQHQRWATLRSELLLAVSAALAREKIAIA